MAMAKGLTTIQQQHIQIITNNTYWLYYQTL